MLHHEVIVKRRLNAQRRVRGGRTIHSQYNTGGRGVGDTVEPRFRYRGLWNTSHSLIWCRYRIITGSAGTTYLAKYVLAFCNVVFINTDLPRTRVNSPTTFPPHSYYVPNTIYPPNTIYQPITLYTSIRSTTIRWATLIEQ